MKHIKTFESAIENLEKKHNAELSILRFSKIVIDIFKAEGKKIKFTQEETPHNYIAEYKLSLTEQRCIFRLFITLDYNIFIFMYSEFGWKEFREFIINFFKIRDDFYNKTISLSSKELNIYSDEILEEWELSRDTKKYNL